MHKFSRGTDPVNMARVKTKYHNWDDAFAKSQEHTTIGDCLYERQSHYCAYCDCLLRKKANGYIEHLERRTDKPQRAFDWSNMFFSCKNKESCGLYKDNTKQHFLLADIVDPSVDNPDDFFVYDMTGNILAKDDAHQYRANETIRVFKLNDSRLINIRAGIAKTVAEILENNPNDDNINDFLQYLKDCNCRSVYFSLLTNR